MFTSRMDNTGPKVVQAVMVTQLVNNMWIWMVAGGTDMVDVDVVLGGGLISRTRLTIDILVEVEVGAPKVEYFECDFS